MATILVKDLPQGAILWNKNFSSMDDMIGIKGLTHIDEKYDNYTAIQSDRNPVDWILGEENGKVDENPDIKEQFAPAKGAFQMLKGVLKND